MRSPYSSPPIPTPDGNIPPPQPRDTTIVLGDWEAAPKTVRSWAYPVTWLSIVVLLLWALRIVSIFPRRPMVGVIAPRQFFGLYNPTDPLGFWYSVVLLFIVALIAFNAWLNIALKKGISAAWEFQILLSAIGLFMFPLGTAINAYILSHWFKPETKA
ncbi:MAG TPA: hypothetical protein VM821_07625 [Abditibacteriaceae bacterium]|nr:hypothetical protein [Abditibacteriaceae bacterium]